MPEKPNESEQKLEQLVEKSRQVLFTAKAMFPFQIVPDRIVIDQNKVTIEYRGILHTEDIHTIPLQDITQVEVTYALFLANLIISSPGHEARTMPFLRIADAVRAKQIIAGLLIARKEQVNLEEVDPNTLADKLADIGKPHQSEQ